MQSTTYEYKLTRSKRKTIALSISKDLTIVVKAPLKMAKHDIETFVLKHYSWIEKQMLIIKERNDSGSNNCLSDDQIDSLKQRAKLLIPQRVAHYGVIMGVSPKGVKVNSAKTRWGSCSAKNILNFSYRIMLLPEELIDYIVVHELAHIIEKNHSSRFYAVVAQYMPDYKTRWAKIKAARLPF